MQTFYNTAVSAHLKKNVYSYRVILQSQDSHQHKFCFQWDIANVWRHFWLSQWGKEERVCYWYLVETRDASKYPTCIRQPPEQRMVKSKCQ